MDFKELQEIIKARRDLAAAQPTDREQIQALNAAVAELALKLADKGANPNV